MFRRYRFAILVLISVLSLVIAPMALGEDERPDGRPAGTERPEAPAAGPSAVGLESGSDRDVQLEGTLDQVILDDLIVDGSACVGFDCVNGESFGFDTLRLKENNLRIKFVDTSSTASFPSNDWQLTANDSSNGGANKFSIDDISGGRTPFTIEAGAPSHSLFVDDGGRLGLGTSTPVADVHVKTGNTPTLRLEQDGSSGFTPQTWDVAGNEANFFIRDATNGSALPFRLRPGAPSSSIDIAASGDIGMRTSSPDAPLDVDIGTATPGTGNAILRLARDGDLGFQLVNTTGGATDFWNLTNASSGTEFRISKSGTGGVEATLDDSGNLLIRGDLTAQGGDGVTDPGDTFPDYVFELDYPLMSFADLERFIASEGHLPNVLTAADVTLAGGINMTQLQLQLLEKVEEAVLYILTQHRTIAALQARIAELESSLTAMEDLEARIAALESQAR